MFFIALATDYDGTLAHDGVVSAETLEALRRFRASGRKLVLVTGRELPDLERVFPDLPLFDVVVAENGALLYMPATKEQHLLAPGPDTKLIARLRQLQVEPLSIGRAIIATWHPNEELVLDAIRDLGLELQIIFNKGAVMVLPANVNKASGLAAALRHLGISPFNVIGFGDAENDHAFLQQCGCAVAVANAIPPLKDDADIVATADRGAGVTEIIQKVLHDEAGLVLRHLRHLNVAFGTDEKGDDIALNPFGGSILVSGGPGGGKSTLAKALLERVVAQGFQVCVVDPEGDYEEFESAIVLGDAKTPPAVASTLDLLRTPEANVVVNMIGLDVDERPAFLLELLPELLNARTTFGRPHWLLFDEAHHMLPAARDFSSASLPRKMPATIFITVHPTALAPDALRLVDTVIAVGDQARDIIVAYCAVLGEPVPSFPDRQLEKGQAFIWTRASAGDVGLASLKPTRVAHRRHARKYAEGNLGEDKSFYFRGPKNALNLRAQNLSMFLQIIDGVDEETWVHHLRAGDYSRWCRQAIRDDDLADELAAIENSTSLAPHEQKSRLKDAIRRRYTAPA